MAGAEQIFQILEALARSVAGMQEQFARQTGGQGAGAKWDSIEKFRNVGPFTGDQNTKNSPRNSAVRS